MSWRNPLRRPANRVLHPASAPGFGGAIALLALLLTASCSSAPTEDGVAYSRHAPAAKPAGMAPQAAEAPKPATAPPAQLAASDAAPTAERGREPLIVPGTGVFTASTGTPHAASADVTPDGDVSFNFVNADVREVVREILGNQLHQNYVVDSKVPATTITAQTGGPVPRNAVLPTLESVLRANGLGLVDVNGLYRIVALEDAAKSSAGGLVGPGGAGYAVRVIPLHFVSATEIKSILEPFLPPGGVLQADSQRNMLIATGPGGDMEGFSALVRQFDVDWLAGTSFALYPLHVGLAKDVAGDLEPIFGDGGSGPLAGLVRIVPIERLNAILVISPQRGYLAQVKAWIDRLDYGDDQYNPRVYQYRVQNSRAADLAAVLTQLLSSGAVSTVGAQTAPGTKLIDLTSQGGGGTGAAGLSAGGIGGGGGLPGLSGGSAGGIPGLPGGAGTPGIGGTSGGMGGIGQPGTSGIAGGTSAPQGTPGGAGAAQNAALQPGLNSGNNTGTLKTPEVRIVADEKNNALVIFARPRDYKMIEDVIKRLDVVPLQVLIEATIAEVTLNNNLQYGLQWFFGQASSKLELTNSGAGTVASSLNAADIAGIFPGFNYIVGGGRVKAVLSALTELTDVEVVSSPELLVLDHQSAALQVGAQVPIITQQAQSVITTGAPVVNSVQYLNTGVILQVTPRVNSSGLVTLDIDQSVSDVANTTSSTINSPTINQRRVVTSAVVQDGETIALGGLISNNQNNAKNGLPILSDIPVLGNLFGTTSRSNARTELLVLLTPRIIRNGKEAREMTDDLRNRMRAVRPLESKTQ